MDCGDTIEGGTDMGVDAPDGDIQDPDTFLPITTGSLRCPPESDLNLVLTTVTLSGTLDLDARRNGARFRPEWARVARVEATDTKSERRFSTAVALEPVHISHSRPILLSMTIWYSTTGSRWHPLQLE